MRGSMKHTKPFPVPVRAAKYSCAKCPAYCCSYPEIEVTTRDIDRLAKHFGLSYREAEERFTKYDAKEKVRELRHKKDRIFASVKWCEVPRIRSVARSSAGSSGTRTITRRARSLPSF